MAEQISAFMAEEGVQVFLGEKLKNFEKDNQGRVKTVITNKQIAWWPDCWDEWCCKTDRHYCSSHNIKNDGTTINGP